MWKVIDSFLRQASIGRSRSSVINPLQWTLLILTGALLVLILEPRAPEPLILAVACADGVILALVIIAYVYFMLNDPDALRSETYSLAKTAIEKNFLGDSLTGLKEVISVLDGETSKLLGEGQDQLLGPGK